MIWLTTKAWPWIKKNWKWVLFPIGIAVAIMTAVTTASLLAQYAEPPRDLDEKTREALKKLRNAEVVRDQKIAELEQRKVERLKELTEDQQAELDELRDRPLKEVVTWFDNL